MKKTCISLLLTALLLLGLAGCSIPGAAPGSGMRWVYFHLRSSVSRLLKTQRIRGLITSGLSLIPGEGTSLPRLNTAGISIFSAKPGSVLQTSRALRAMSSIPLPDPACLPPPAHP